eukprot:m.282597 g.282597  ORF g.282597 m.282597 type:complete len:215 (-) comp54940_c0_seq15:1910-2554(-)
MLPCRELSLPTIHVGGSVCSSDSQFCLMCGDSSDLLCLTQEPQESETFESPTNDAVPTHSLTSPREPIDSARVSSSPSGIPVAQLRKFASTHHSQQEGEAPIIDSAHGSSDQSSRVLHHSVSLPTVSELAQVSVSPQLAHVHPRAHSIIVEHSADAAHGIRSTFAHAHHQRVQFPRQLEEVIESDRRPASPAVVSTSTTKAVGRASSMTTHSLV